MFRLLIHLPDLQEGHIVDNLNESFYLKTYCYLNFYLSKVNQEVYRLFHLQQVLFQLLDYFHQNMDKNCNYYGSMDIPKTKSTLILSI